MVAGAAEFEKELQNNYNKRFIVQEVRRDLDENLSYDQAKASIKSNQLPIIVKIAFGGTGTGVNYYQNAFGAQASGAYPTTNLQVVEFMPDESTHSFLSYDYGMQSYGAGTFALGRTIFAIETNPRKNTKNAIKAYIHDICVFNDNINKFADHEAYEIEYNRFTGNFKPIHEAQEKRQAETKARIDKFISWCNTNLDPEVAKGYIMGMNTLADDNTKLAYINYMKNMGFYKE